MDSIATLQNSWLGNDTKDRLSQELLYALHKVPKEQFAKCLLRTPSYASKGMGLRVKRLYNTAKQFIVGTDDLVSDACSAIKSKDASVFVESYWNPGVVSAKSFAKASTKIAYGVPNWISNLKANPTHFLPEFMGAILGFIVGSGGFDANGGLPDIDLLLGIGAHRSVFTHSIVIGASTEAVIISLNELVLLIYEHLPKGYSPKWDDLYNIFNRTISSTKIGAGLGIAYHLGADGTVQVSTYKDLPVSVSLGTHQAIFATNAATEGIYNLTFLQQKRAEKYE
jgi:hypothetical protein